VVPRPVLTILVYALPLLIVVFGVLMGGFALAHGTGDQPAASVLWWVAMGCLMLVVTDLILLVGVLGIGSLSRPDHRQDPPGGRMRDEG